MKIDQIVGLKALTSQTLGGAGISWLVRDELAGSDDNAATLGQDAGPANPATFSFLPQSGTSGGGNASFAMPTSVALIEDYGSKSGLPAVDSFAGGPPGGGGGAVFGGSALTPYTATANNMTFVINWDSSVGSAPSGFITGFEAAVGYFLANLTGPAAAITITLAAGWGEAGGSTLPQGALGESLTYLDPVSYSALQSKMPTGYLPTQDPIGGNHYYWVPTAEEKALGLVGNNTSLDGDVGFSSGVSWNFTSTTGTGQYDFVSVAEHEISEVMGRLSLGGGTLAHRPHSYSVFDLFRFSAPGTHSPNGGTAAYFSFDNGQSSDGNTSHPKTYFNTTPGGDYGDWQSSGSHSAGNDAYDAFASAGTTYTASNVDKLVMDVLGYGKVA